MNLNLDDDATDPELVERLRRAGHHVHLPAEVGRSGSHDAVHLRHAIRENRVFLTYNRRDFRFLHELVLEVGGHHPGILVVGLDNDLRRDMKVRDVVRAIANLLKARIPLGDEYHVLNYWR